MWHMTFFLFIGTSLRECFGLRVELTRSKALQMEEFYFVFLQRSYECAVTFSHEDRVELISKEI